MNYQTIYLLEVMIKKLTLILFLLITAKGAFANDCFPKKNNLDLVYDKANLLSKSEAQQINSFLTNVSNQTSNQIVVVIQKDLCGEEPSMFATELGQQWGVGRDGEDNGIVILLKYTGVPGENKAFIAVGYGLEGVIPDATAKLIVENEMLPYFKKDRYADGLKAALNVIVPLVKQEFDYVAYEASNGNKKKGFPFFIIAIILIFILAKVNSARSYSRANGVDLWTAMMLGGMMGGSAGGRRGGFSDFTSGGGGFGGFGGGGFGGGGAGGSW